MQINWKNKYLIEFDLLCLSNRHSYTNSFIEFRFIERYKSTWRDLLNIFKIINFINKF